MSVITATLSFDKNGFGKTHMPIPRMFLEAVLAGFYIAVAGVASTIGMSTITNPSVAKVVQAIIFPAGLGLVVLNGAELFTGNSLLIISLWDKTIDVMHLLKNWGIVYIGNFIGSLLVSLLTVYGGVFSAFNNKAAISATSIAITKCNLSFQDAFLKGIMCNILVCVAVMIALEDAAAAHKLMNLYLPIFMFVLSGYEHSIANMSYIPIGLLLKHEKQVTNSDGLFLNSANWGKLFYKNLIPVTLGNIVGGVAVGTSYWFNKIYMVNYAKKVDEEKKKENFNDEKNDNTSENNKKKIDVTNNINSNNETYRKII